MLCRSLFALFLLAIVLSVLLDIRILITSLVSSNSSNSIQIFNGEFIEFIHLQQYHLLFLINGRVSV